MIDVHTKVRFWNATVSLHHEVADDVVDYDAMEFTADAKADLLRRIGRDLVTRGRILSLGSDIVIGHYHAPVRGDQHGRASIDAHLLLAASTPPMLGRGRG